MNKKTLLIILTIFTQQLFAEDIAKIVESKPIENKNTEIIENKNITISLDVCKQCHGWHWEKSALGKSKIVSTFSQKEINDALLGYKSGTYGGVMKNIMAIHANKYSDQEIKQIAEQIKPNDDLLYDKKN